MPQVQRKRRRLGQSENGCTRRRSERPDHVWSYDFIHDQTADGRGLKMLPVVDEFTRECLTIEVERGLTAEDVVSTLEYLFEVRGEPEFIRSDNGPEFIAEAVRSWLARRGSKTLYIAPGSPWENAYSETFNSRLRDELLDREVFETLKEAKVHPRRPSPGLQPPPAAQLAGVSDPGGVRSGPDQAGGRFAPPGRRRADPRPRTLITPGPEFGGRSRPHDTLALHLLHRVDR